MMRRFVLKISEIEVGNRGLPPIAFYERTFSKKKHGVSFCFFLLLSFLFSLYFIKEIRTARPEICDLMLR